jgi:hypothetical protein
MKLVIALAALLVAALIGLAIWLGVLRDEPSPAAETIAVRPSARAPSPTEPAGEPPAPALPSADEVQPPPIRETIQRADGVTIHSRRPAGSIPRDPERQFTAAEGIHLTREYATKVTALMQPAAKQCLATSLPEESRSDKTRLHVKMTVKVKNGSLTVSDVAGQVPGLEDSVVAPTLACLREQMVGNVLDATGQPDLASYSITTYYSP